MHIWNDAMWYTNLNVLVVIPLPATAIEVNAFAQGTQWQGPYAPWVEHPFASQHCLFLRHKALWF